VSARPSVRERASTARADRRDDLTRAYDSAFDDDDRAREAAPRAREGRARAPLDARPTLDEASRRGRGVLHHRYDAPQRANHVARDVCDARRRTQDADLRARDGRRRAVAPLRTPRKVARSGRDDRPTEAGVRHHAYDVRHRDSDALQLQLAHASAAWRTPARPGAAIVTFGRECIATCDHDSTCRVRLRNKVSKIAHVLTPTEPYSAGVSHRSDHVPGKCTCA
jgi:hypothetical protein